jgi:hypothetical protein
MRKLGKDTVTKVALAAFLLVCGASSTVAGSGQRPAREWMACVPFQIVIDTTLAVHENATAHRMTAEQLRRFGPAEEGVWFERDDAKKVYVLFFRGGCLDALRELTRAEFDRLLTEDD